MRSFFRKGIATIAVVASIGFVAAEIFQNFPVLGECSASDGAEDAAYEVTEASAP